MLSPENLFARELIACLLNHRAALHDLTEKPFEIHPMIIYRLKNAVDDPHKLGKTFTFPTLSPEDLRQIMAHYHFSPAEQQRLKAALLTNIMLVKLMARKPLGAIHITQKLFELFIQALSEDQDLMDSIESGELGVSQEAFHDAYMPIVWRFDQASLAMHVLTAEWCDNDERIKAAYEAYRLFHQVILDLYLFALTEQQKDPWLYLHHSAQQQKEQAKRFLMTMGLEP